MPTNKVSQVRTTQCYRSTCIPRFARPHVRRILDTCELETAKRIFTIRNKTEIERIEAGSSNSVGDKTEKSLSEFPRTVFIPILN